MTLYFIIVILNLVVFLFLLFKKANLHFKLIKKLYPEELMDVSNLVEFNNSFKQFNLPIKDLIWVYFPIYIKRKITSEFNEAELKVHHSLIDVSNYILSSLVLFVFLTWGLYYIFSLFGITAPG